MAGSWSDPYSNQPTSASLTNAARVEQPGYALGHIVSAILQFRNEQAQRQFQERQQTFNNIARAAGEYQANANAGSANDAANATMYGIQNPSDPYGGFQDPNRVPDYGGTDALRALESAKSLGAYETPEQKALHAAQLDHLRAEAWKTWQYPNGASYGSPDINASAANALARQAGDMLGVNPGELNNVTRGDFDKSGNFVPSPDGSQAMVGGAHTASWPGKKGFFGMGASPSGSGVYDYSNVYPANQVNQAVGLYQQAMAHLGLGLGGASSTGSGVASGAASGLFPGVRQSDVDQASARLASENVPYGQEIPPEANPPQQAAAPPPASTPATKPVVTGARSTNKPVVGNLPSPPADNGEGLAWGADKIMQELKSASTTPSGSQPGSTPSPRPTPAVPPGTRREVNGQIYVWDGRGWSLANG